MAHQQRDCPLCGEPLEEAPAVHDAALCEKNSLLRTIQQLRQDIVAWKEAWHHQRDIIGRLSWTHHSYVCPHEMPPPTPPDPFQDAQGDILQVGNEVFLKENQQWRKVGSTTAPDGAKAIVRLMSLPDADTHVPVP